MNTILIDGLGVSLIASILIAYGRIFRTKHTIEKESDGNAGLNRTEMQHRLIETRIAQIGAVLLVLGFAIQIFAHIILNS
ncbi:MAG: hypothetical protein M3044_05825 [Thermoproteota archaeon]|nr:hypothetical protein [Thermoproteota archaeon]